MLVTEYCDGSIYLAILEPYLLYFLGVNFYSVMVE
jgi:hypothetical protein